MAAVVETQGNLWGSYSVHGLVDTPDRLEAGDLLCTKTYTRLRCRVDCLVAWSLTVQD